MENDRLTFYCKLTDDDLEMLKKICDMPDEIKAEIVDIYNYLVTQKASGATLKFSDGMKIHIKLDISEYSG